MPPGDSAPGSPGPGRLIGLIYGFFALAATGRAGYQLATRASEAPIAYGLSALAALVYVVGAALVIVVENTGRHRRTAIAWCIFELIGLVSVGTLSVVDPEAFPDSSVWSEYGAGYVFIPVVLPVAAMWWLLASRDRAPQQDGDQSARRSA